MWTQRNCACWIYMVKFCQHIFQINCRPSHRKSWNSLMPGQDLTRGAASRQNPRFHCWSQLQQSCHGTLQHHLESFQSQGNHRADPATMLPIHPRISWMGLHHVSVGRVWRRILFISTTSKASYREHRNIVKYPGHHQQPSSVSYTIWLLYRFELWQKFFLVHIISKLWISSSLE